jgi:tetratricopeptide (TPR) repeat protein
VFGRRSNQRDQELERKYDRHLTDSIRAAIQGRHTEAAQHSEAALAVSRDLYANSSDPARHRPALAAALYNHAGNLRRIGRDADALTLLAEAGEHYNALVQTDRRSFSVPAIDVVVRTGLALQAAGDRDGAVQRFREAIEAYPTAPTNDRVERDLGLARTQFHLGRCLLEIGPGYTEGLAEIDTGLFAAERTREQQGITATDFSWLGKAPRSFQLIATDWIGAAVCAMEMHDAAGRFDIAADAANIAVRVSGGLAAMGGAARAPLYDAVLGRARVIWQHAQNPVRAAVERAGPGQEIMVGGGRIHFATPDIAGILRATGWTSS